MKFFSSKVGFILLGISAVLFAIGWSQNTLGVEETGCLDICLNLPFPIWTIYLQYPGVKIISLVDPIFYTNTFYTYFLASAFNSFIYYIIGCVFGSLIDRKSSDTETSLSNAKKIIILILIAFYVFVIGAILQQIFADKRYAEEQERTEKASLITNFENKAGESFDTVFVPFDRNKTDRLYTYTSDKAEVYELNIHGPQENSLPDLQVIIYETNKPENVNWIIKDLLIRYRAKGATVDPSPTMAYGNKTYQNLDYRNMYLWSSDKFVIYFNTGTDEMVQKYFEKYPSDLK